MNATTEDKAILEQELFSVIEPTINELRGGPNDYVCNPDPSSTDIAIYDSVMYRLTGKSSYLQSARTRIQSALVTIFNEPFRLKRLGGHLGAVWFAELLDPDLIEAPTKKEFLEITKFHVESSPEANLEFMYGLSGVGISLQKFSGFPEARECLSIIANTIIRRAVWEKDCCHWDNHGEGFMGKMPLGYAHGLYGIIDFLALELLRGEGVKGLEKVLDGACNWLFEYLKQREFNHHSNPVSNSNNHNYEEPIWWCHGLIGAIIPLLRSGKALGDPRWTAFAQDLLPASYPDVPARSGVCASGLCHGYLGNLCILLKAFKISNNTAYLDAANPWLEKFVDRITGFGPQKELALETLIIKYNWDRHDRSLSGNFETQMNNWNLKGHESNYMMGFAGIGASIAMVLANRCDQWGFEEIMFP